MLAATSAQTADGSQSGHITRVSYGTSVVLPGVNEDRVPMHLTWSDAMKKIVSILSMLVFVASARAANGFCYSETVTQLIMQNSNVYFSTSKSCQTWCLLPQTWSAAAQAQAFATLLTARTTGQTVSVQWADQPADGSCTNAEAQGSSPLAIIL